MKGISLFKDRLFDQQLLRTVSHASCRGADVGECLSTVSKLSTKPTAADWYSQWFTTAKRIHETAVQSLLDGKWVSASDAFLRACNYYRCAQTFVREEQQQAWALQRQCFQEACYLQSPPILPMQIPYQDKILSGYYYPAQHSKHQHRQGTTLIFTHGHDGTAEELFFLGAEAAWRRGYHCITYDGPGQASALFEQGLPFQVEWEQVISSILDYVYESVPEVKATRIVLVGRNFGALLAARAAAYDERVKGLVLVPAIESALDWVKWRIPYVDTYMKAVASGSIATPKLIRMLWKQLWIHNPSFRHFVHSRMQAHGCKTISSYLQHLSQYSIKGLYPLLTCPTVVAASGQDSASSSQCRAVFEKLMCNKRFVQIGEAEGAHDTMLSGASFVLHERLFANLDSAMVRMKAM